MNIKRDFTIILVGVVLVSCYILLNKNYMEGVKDCTKNYDVSYCKQVMSE